MPPPTDEAGSDGDHDSRLGISNDIIHLETFRVILGLDEDEPGFSRDVVLAFFDQAKETLRSMEKALTEKDLRALQGFSYFLRGSAETIGIRRVHDGCDTIVRFHWMQHESKDVDLDLETSLRRISEMFRQVKADCDDAERELKSFYDRNGNV
ncbi:Fc.00g051440.m01.CDS01 [Cosmosporella sp. VM-42]